MRYPIALGFRILQKNISYIVLFGDTSTSSVHQSGVNKKNHHRGWFFAKKF